MNHLYEDLINEVLENGSEKTNRTVTGPLSRFGVQMRLDLSAGFLMIKTKSSSSKAFWLRTCSSFVAKQAFSI